MNPNRKPWVKSFAKRWSKRLLLTALWIGGLGTLFFGIENWRAKRALAEHYEWLKSKGESLDPAQFDPAPVPDEDNAALVPVLECFYKRDADGKRVWRTSKDNLSPEDETMLAEWRLLFDTSSALEECVLEGPGIDFATGAAIIQQQFTNGATGVKHSGDDNDSKLVLYQHMARFRPLFEGLRLAGNRSQCVWPKSPIAYGNHEGGITTTKLQRALHLDAKLALFDQDNISVYQDLMTQMRLASESATPPSVMGALRDAGIGQHSIELIRICLGGNQFNEIQWAQIADRSHESPWLNNLRTYLRGERILREVAWVNLPPSDWGVVKVRGSPSPWTYKFMLGPNGWRDRNRISVNVFTQKMLESLDNATPPILKSFVLTEPVHSNSPYDFLTETISYRHAYVDLCRMAELRQLTPVAIALKRYQIKHGAFPDNLTQVVPEFLPQLPLSYFNAMVPKYRRLPEGSFKLWFYGLDGDDDDGRAQDRSKDGASQDYDIVFKPGSPIP